MICLLHSMNQQSINKDRRAIGSGRQNRSLSIDFELMKVAPCLFCLLANWGGVSNVFTSCQPGVTDAQREREAGDKRLSCGI